MDPSTTPRCPPVPASLAGRWRWEYRHALARRTGSAAWVLGGCWVLFVAMDLLTLPAAQRGWIVEIEVALGLAVVPLLVWLSRRPWWRQMPRVVAALLAVVGLGIEAKMGAIAAAGGLLRYDGLLLYVLGVYVLAGLSWRDALAVGAAIGAGWALLVSACALEREVMTSVYLACANVIGVSSTRITERHHREAFQRRLLVEQERERVQHLADALAVKSMHDELTGLPNRRALAQDGERLWAAAREAEQLVLVAMIDVDHFKAYNDTLGHPAGDEVLRKVASALQVVTLGEDELAFRCGGEEFVVLWRASDPSEALLRSERLHAAIRALGVPHPASRTSDLLTVSVGLAAGAAEVETLKQALGRADALLYQAKSTGRARTRLGHPPAAMTG